jgi:hypothetical protein
MMTTAHSGFHISKLVRYFSMTLAGVLGISFAGGGVMLLFSAFASADHTLAEALFGLFFTVAGAGAITVALAAFRRERAGPSRSSTGSMPQSRAAKAAQPSVKSGLILGGTILFGLPFIVVGVAALVLPRLQGGTGTADPLFVTGVGVAFSAVGLSIYAIGLAMWRSVRSETALRSQYPESPWMWKKEWTTGTIPDENGAAAGALITLALIWNSFVWPVFLFVVRRDAGKIWALLVTSALALAGVLLLWAAIRALLVRVRFGQSFFTMATLPGRIGSPLKGAIETTIVPGPGMSDGCFVVKLSCMRRLTTGSGDSRTTVEQPAWGEEQRVPFVSSSPGPRRGVVVPVSFDIPPGLPPTSTDDIDDQIRWRLEARAELPGVDYEAQWQVPVY